MIEVDAVLSPAEDIPDMDCWLVMDLLRATTNIVHFFHLGGKLLLPVEGVEEARKIKRTGGHDWLLMGERGCVAPHGFDMGNSPLEYSRELVERKPFAILTTTNGTKAALKAGEKGVPAYAACARNAAAAVEKALASGRRIGLLCAGSEGRMTLEDAVCCGLLVDIMTKKDEPVRMSDGALAALDIWKSCGGILAKGVEKARHCIILRELGFGKDVDFCCETDKTETVPGLSFRDGYHAFVGSI